MSSTLPTTVAVAAAVRDHRLRLDLTRDELSYALGLLGHELSAQKINELEAREYAATVDDLMALAVVLDTTPTEMLTHIPDEPFMPLTDQPLATGLPADITQGELVAWMHGQTTLDHAGRYRWAETEVARLRITAVHHEDQLQGARAELGELADRTDTEPGTEASSVSMQVLELHERVADCDHVHNQSSIALAYAEQRFETMQERYDRAQRDPGSEA